jgi:hypothetical protein
VASIGKSYNFYVDVIGLVCYHGYKVAYDKDDKGKPDESPGRKAIGANRRTRSNASQLPL